MPGTLNIGSLVVGWYQLNTMDSLAVRYIQYRWRWMEGGKHVNGLEMSGVGEEDSVYKTALVGSFNGIRTRRDRFSHIHGHEMPQCHNCCTVRHKPLSFMDQIETSLKFEV